MNKWISVEDSLPDNDRWVLVAFKYYLLGIQKSSIDFGYFSQRSSWNLSKERDYCNYQVTWWQEIPSLPEEK